MNTSLYLNSCSCFAAMLLLYHAFLDFSLFFKNFFKVFSIQSYKVCYQKHIKYSSKKYIWYVLLTNFKQQKSPTYRAFLLLAFVSRKQHKRPYVGRLFTFFLFNDTNCIFYPFVFNLTILLHTLTTTVNLFFKTF